ncbi:hypothetical protein [Enterobacter pseudoroggenkampii]|uniref:hypothetical protein n=1 Tax=Enterobacter pseudoroggenkampii TaxID=2996112 RepID=UPI00226467BF|nr:hypothetical protein [Enterobacter pseudoroggenkampii]MCX8288309.1 hypothetical protein [Enterobacter pseudoroggenkampii]
MIYRFYRRDAIKTGEYYFSVLCHGCGQYIYVLDDPSKGKADNPFVGDGKLSIPCNRCSHDDIYELTEIKSIPSTEDLASTYPSRATISKSSRKPLIRSYPYAKVTMGVGYIEDRPKAAALVGKIITSWADIEVQCARLLSVLMNTAIPESAAVFGSLRNSRSQSDALIAVAEISLSQKDLELFNAFLKRKAALEKERNDLAHGCFGVSVSIPEHIVWVSQSDFLNFSIAHAAGIDGVKFKEKLFVYELGTLERIAMEISEFHAQLGYLVGHIRASKEGRVDFCKENYQVLITLPFIKEFIQSPKREK